jgi:Winged helix DNA-binding domain
VAESGTVRVLTRRELGRALLARNLLLERSPLDPLAAVRHLVGLQAQEPQEPWLGLLARLDGVDLTVAGRLLEERSLVRTHLMRRTVHLVTAEDCLALRPLHADVLLSRMRAVLSRRLVGVDEGELAAAGGPLFEAEPRTVGEVGRALAARWPQASARDLGDALSSLVPLVQVPPRGLWQQQGPARCTTVRAWLGRDPEDPPLAADGLVLRYLRAFGPAATADVRAWSGLAGLRDAVARLRPRLRTFRDERGRLLFDVPDGPLPDADTPAPPRFLPAFDNAVLGYDDRSRIIDDEHRGLSVAGARVLLVDGRVAATWTTRLDDGAAVLEVAPLRDRARSEDVDAEADRVLAALAPEGVERRVEWLDPG